MTFTDVMTSILANKPVSEVQLVAAAKHILDSMNDPISVLIVQKYATKLVEYERAPL